jgi:hypothetical protein
MKRRTILLMLAGHSACWAAPRPRILVVESYHADFLWDHDYRQVLIELLGERYSLEFFEMDTKRLPTELHAGMGQKALTRIRAVQPALVMLGDDAALRYVGEPLDKLGIPGVYLGINGNPRNYGQMNFKNITGVLERPLIKRNIVFIRRIMPTLRKVLVLFDNDLTSQLTFDEMFDGKPSLEIDGIQADLKLCNTLEFWKHSILTAPADGYQITIAGLYHTLTRPNGKVADADEVIAWASANTRLPLFALWGFAVGARKAIGGLVLSSQEQGKVAAGIALDILERGAKPSERIPVTARQGDFIFSRSQLARFNLTLPPDIAAQAHLLE